MNIPPSNSVTENEKRKIIIRIWQIFQQTLLQARHKRRVILHQIDQEYSQRRIEQIKKELNK